MTSRSQSLDVLRGIAVLLVLVDHYALIIKSTNPLFDTFGRGVDLFFVLSGFLISGLLFSEYKSTGTLDLLRFWVRRGFKIYPAFYVFIFAMTIFSVAKMPGRVFLDEALFLQGYARHFWIHTWSLAVEEHFYLVLPLLLLMLVRFFPGRENPFRLLPVLSIVISALCLYMRMLAAHGPQFGISTHLRMDALFAGVSLGYFRHFDWASFQQANRPWVLAIGILFAVALLAMPVFFQLTFAYIAFSCIVAWTASRPQRSSYFGRPMACIGRHSYSIYLWHAAVVVWMARLPAKWYRLPAYICTAIVLGVVMSKLVEFPLLHFRDKFFPSMRTRAVPSNVADANPVAFQPVSEGSA